MAGRFARVETRRRARGFLLGLLADLPRKNCWSTAEHAGDADPHGMQHLLNRAVVDTDGMRDDLRDYVTAGLGDADAVLVIDETGDLKKGNRTVGAQPQYTGTAGRVENAQVAVYFAYAGARGHAMIDRELYLPKSWTTDPDRPDQAGVPGRDRVPDQACAGRRDGSACPERGRHSPVGGRGRGLRRRPGPARRTGNPPELIALTCNEIRRLFTIFVIEPGRVLTCLEAWSHWRRRHQYRARTSHYQHQETARAWT
jgi:hypothetical protein